jgi:hypothetical protein
VGQHINVSNMIGLQRVRGLWRIYLDNQEERELLLTLVLRNKSVNFYTRNPRYAYTEKTYNKGVCERYTFIPFPRHLEHFSFSAHGLGWP